MATLPVTVTHNFTGENLGLDPIDQILFQNTATAVATFGSNQFGAGAGLIANNVLLTGNGFVSQITVNLSATGTFSAAGWQFATWDATDNIILNGTTGGDTITGSSREDSISGRAGADTLAGGADDDAFLVSASGDIAAGEAIDGGADNDILFINVGTHDLTLAGTTVVNVERLLLNGNNVSVTASGTHFGGAGDFTSVEGNAALAQALVVNGQTVNLSSISFTGWGGANQTITINGTNVTVNVLSGSSQKDTINGTGSSTDAMRGFGGADFLNGGNGDDTFFYNAAGEVEEDEIILGGGGTDTISLSNADGSDFSRAAIDGVETLDFVSGASTVTFAGSQFGAGAIVNVSGGSGAEALTILSNTSVVDLSGVNFTSWTDGTDTIKISGLGSAETLTGSNKNDIIIGGGGADHLIGGDGDDVFRYTATGDAGFGENVNGGSGTDTLEIVGGVHDFSSGVSLNSIEALRFMGAGSATFQAPVGAGVLAITAVTGSAGADAIVANAESTVPGVGVNLSGVTFTAWTDGTDTITINGLAVGETLTGSNHADIITGFAGADTLNGGDGDDVFRYTATGEETGDFVQGGSGTDTLEITGGTYDFLGGAFASADALRFTNLSGTTSATFTSTLGGSGTTAITGSAGINAIVANLVGNEDLSALTFTPGTWTDGTDTITMNGDSSVNILTGSSRNDIINGLGDSDTLNGGGGDDTIAGGVGTDALDGGSGDDTYILDAEASGTDTVTDSAGTDTITSTINRDLGFADYSEIEDLRLTGTAANGTGNANVNKLVGNAVTNTLTAAGGGPDTLIGLDANDVYNIRLGDIVVEAATATAGASDIVQFTGTAGQTYILAANVERLTLLGTAATNGTGNAAVNAITGNIAANVLTASGAHADTLIGLAGNDTYNIDATIDAVVEAAGAANGAADHVKWTGTAGQTYTLAANVELLTLMGSAATNGTGNAVVNTITGNAAANVLTAVGAGNVDILKGLAGNDTYNIDTTIDTVVEVAGAANGAADHVKWTGTAGQAYTLAASVELLTLMGSAATNATGNAVVNTITGNAAANVLTAAGTGNVDILKGLAGNDTYNIDATIDTVVEVAGAANGAADHVKWTGTAGQTYTLAANVELLTLLGGAATIAVGNASANTITGNTAANTIKGRDGDDILLGGGGTDSLFGENNSDTFRFLAVGDSAVGATRDVISDLDDFGNDVIDLSLMAGVNAFIGAAAFTAAGQVRAIQAGANVLVQINTAGAGGAESEILIANATLGGGIGQVDAGDFLL